MLQDVESLGAENTLLDFFSLCKIALQDTDPAVRLPAVRILWEYEYKGIIVLFLNLLNNETIPEVRAAAASGLGRFIYAGEIDKLPAAKLEEIENRLFDLFSYDDDQNVRLAALESLGYSSREEVAPLIHEAFGSTDNKWKKSALLAMGRSANQEWQPEILTMLKSKYMTLRLEAARAAGELELRDAVSFILEILEDADDELRTVCIWSLSQIGGEEASEKLDQIYEETEDEDELEFIESALENLSFTEGARLMPLFELPESDESEEDDDEWTDDFANLEELLDEEEDNLD